MPSSFRIPVSVDYYKIEKNDRGYLAFFELIRHYMAETGVCIKIIDRSKSNNVNLDIIYREVQIHTPLSHLNIVSLYHFLESNSMFYFISDEDTE